jgi:hypothetical protein
LREIVGRGRPDRRLIEGEPADRQPGRGTPQGEDPAGGEPEHRRGATGRRDHGGEVVDLMLDAVVGDRADRGGVGAVTAAAAVVTDHGVAVP